MIENTEIINLFVSNHLLSNKTFWKKWKNIQTWFHYKYTFEEKCRNSLANILKISSNKLGLEISYNIPMNKLVYKLYWITEIHRIYIWQNTSIWYDYIFDIIHSDIINSRKDEEVFICFNMWINIAHLFDMVENSFENHVF